MAEPSAAVRGLVGLFRSMKGRGEPVEVARRSVLQLAVALFAKDTGQEPRGLLAAGVDPVALTAPEQDLLALATGADWSRIHPGTLGTLLEATLGDAERRGHGAHYTPEVAILEHVVRPTLVEPWRARLQGASTLAEIVAVRDALAALRILNPACGGGSFLHVAHRELVRLERALIEKAHERFPADAPRALGAVASTGARQLFGIDKDPLAVEVAKLTLLFAEARAGAGARARGLAAAPPVDLDENFRCDDALFCAWPPADVILGNPPFLSKNKVRQALGPGYVERVRARYPDVPGRADHCVYWFRRAHDELAPGARAGLVGTNTIRQNDSREGGLAHIVANGGTITEAVSTMVWPGEAVVHVSVVNWIKGAPEGPKALSWQQGDARDGPWERVTLDKIPASLSAGVDVTTARPLRANAASGGCFQGQTHGHEAFLLSADEARAMLRASPRNAEVLFPYLVGEELLTEPGGRPTRWVIDFHPRDQRGARRYEAPFSRVEGEVLRARKEAAARERARNAALRKSGDGTRQNQHHEAFLRRWWQLGYPRGRLMAKLAGLTRYIACSRVTKRPIFEVVSAAIHPGDALSVFPLQDDYSFGVLQSGLHWRWFAARGSSMKGDQRYTSSTVFDSFPWPQAPSAAQIGAVADAAVALRALRRDLAARRGLSLRALYADMERPGHHPLEDAHAALDATVGAAYGMPPREDPLAFLLALNHACAAREAAGLPIAGPGLPPGTHPAALVSEDAVQPPDL